MKYVIYLRVSTNTQDVSSQRKSCLDYIQKRGGGEWVEYADINVSGSLRLEDREEMEKAIESLKPGDIFLVDHRDRLGRDPVWNVLSEKEINRKGAKVETVSMSFEGMDEGTAQLLKTMLDGFAKFELYLIGRRTRNKLKEIKSNGFRVGRVPYGYQLGEAIERSVMTPKGPDKKISFKITKNLTEWAILSEMEQRSQSGQSTREIARSLNTVGKLNRAGTPWSHVSIHKILKNAPTHRAVY